MTTRVQAGSFSVSNPSKVVSLFAAGILGVILVGGVGFLGSPMVHDAAHDVRHMLSFPCH